MGASQQDYHGDNSNNEKAAQVMETTHTERVIVQDKKIDGDAASSDSSDGVENDEEKAKGFRKPYVKSEAEKKLVRKIACTLMPFVAWILMLQFADKAALSVSAVLGIYDDVHLTGSQFSWLGSMFFIGHLVCQPFNNILLQKLPVGRYLGVCIFIWGFIMLATAGQGSRNNSDLESNYELPPYFFSVYLIVNTLFRRSEQTTFYGIVTMASGWGSIFGGLVAYGISNLGHQRGIMMWRWNHIIFGALTILLGLLCFFFLVDNPKSWLLRLTEEEEKIADERTRDNAVVRHQNIKWGQMLEALTEVRFYCICLAVMGLNMQNGALQVFSAQFIKELGDFTAGESILLKVPAGTCSFLGVVFATIVARRTGQICYTGAFMSTVSLIGCIILAVVEQGPAKLAGFYISWFLTGGYSLLITTIGTNVSGYSKKIFYNGAFVIFYTIGNFIGPLCMVEREAPRYTGAMIGFCIGNGVAIASYLVMRFMMAKENQKRLANPPAEETDVTLDLTDKQDRNYIYKL
ncbi:major facilitator superfamily domain-containing protein [Zychaea mexicana]|uniref:major facilitator superfamily domain-containing protein n=1 Tax=Zychaea mexicana TaxID=64656 RepID=UPI0022FEB0C2|nr:major facilitator superfamily domain-containing protein [Zychaea mexicana]KAI9499362.1 major facilitator superfamily domain-containing protein [Zychaea mexicana]